MTKNSTGMVTSYIYEILYGNMNHYELTYICSMAVGYISNNVASYLYSFLFLSPMLLHSYIQHWVSKSDLNSFSRL